MPPKPVIRDADSAAAGWNYDAVNVKTFVDPSSHAADHHFYGPGKPWRRLISSIAMRAGAIDDEHLALRILCHSGGCYLAARDVDRTLHMALCEGVRPAHIHKDEIRIGRFRLSFTSLQSVSNASISSKCLTASAVASTGQLPEPSVQKSRHGVGHKTPDDIRMP